MGMVVRTNYSSLNSTRNLNLNNKALDGSLEKLSSGYKINKSADDASGLAISEKMKAQIKALDTASANAEDGISFIQTAEGYLSEVHNMLNRMVELSMKSANGTTESVSGASQANANSGIIGAAGTDRDALQLEMDQLCAEIDRIANTANFNNVRLFDGSLSTTGYNKLSVTKANATGASAYTNTNAFSLSSIQGGYVTTNIGLVSAMKGPTNSGKTSGLRLQIGETSRESDKMVIGLIDLSTAALFKNISTYVNGDGSISATRGAQVTQGRGVNLVQFNTANSVLGPKDASNAKGAAVTGFTINISNQNSASLASDALRSVINDVSMQRAELGARQNRLEYTINNLDTASENISAANSRIRDTDVAKEMSRYTKNNVLVQAAQSMLAQANGRTQQALQLMG